MKNLISTLCLLLILSLFIKGDDIIVKREFYDSGKVKREILFNKETKKSKMKIYYESGELLAIIPIKNGFFNGIERNYFKNGHLKNKSTLKNGISEGTSKSFFESGKLKSISTYKAGKLHGFAKDFYESGEIATKWEHKEIASIGKSYYETGELKFDIKFNDLKLIFIKGYDKAGKPFNGNVTLFYKSGKLNTKGYFINGLPDGKLISYFESGKISEIGNFIKGKPDGDQKSFHESGKLFLKVPYHNEEIHGVVEIYSDELPNTVQKIYYNNGNKINEEIYEDGKLIKKSK